MIKHDEKIIIHGNKNKLGFRISVLKVKHMLKNIF